MFSKTVYYYFSIPSNDYNSLTIIFFSYTYIQFLIRSLLLFFSRRILFIIYTAPGKDVLRPVYCRIVQRPEIYIGRDSGKGGSTIHARRGRTPENRCAAMRVRVVKRRAGERRVYIAFLRCTCSCATDECTVSTGCRRSWTGRDGPEGAHDETDTGWKGASQVIGPKGTCGRAESRRERARETLGEKDGGTSLGG